VATTPLQVGVTVDLAELKAGFDTAGSVVKSSSAQMKDALKASEKASTQLADAFKQLAPAAASGSAQALSILSEYGNKARAAAAEVKVLQKAQQDAATAAAKAIFDERAALQQAKDAVKQLDQAIREQGAHTVSSMQASSAAVRALEGGMNGNVRAAERFLGTTLGLGPALQAAFPIFGALAVADILVKVGETVGKLITAFQGMSLAERDATLKAIDLGEKIITIKPPKFSFEELAARSLGAKAQDSKIDFQSPQAKQREIADAVELQRAYDRLNEAGLKGSVLDAQKNKDQEAMNAKLLQSAVAQDKIAQSIKNQLDATETIKNVGNENLGAGTTYTTVPIIRDKDAVKQLTDAYREASQAAAKYRTDAQVADINAKADKKAGGVAGENEAAKAARQAAAAQRKEEREEDKADRAADEAGYIALQQQGHTLSLEEERAYWTAREAIAGTSATRLLDIQKRIASLTQEISREQDAFAKQGLEVARSAGQLGGTKEDIDALKDSSTATREWAEAVGQARDIALANKDALDEAAIKQAEETGSLTKSAAAAALAAVHTREYAEAMAKLNAQLAIAESESDGPKKKADIQSLQNQAAQLGGARQIQAGADSANQSVQVDKPWLKAFRSIDKAWTSTMDGILLGQTTVAQGFERLGSRMAIAIINSLTKTLAADFEKNAASLASHSATEATKTGVTLSANATRQASGLLAALKTAAQNAMSAATGAYSATAGIPVIGPVQAPIAAGEAYTAVIGLQGLASAAGGWGQVPNDTLAMIHKDEMVMPANLASSIRGMAQGKGSGGGSMALTMHNSFNGISDKKMFLSMMGKSERNVAAVMTKARRNGRL
jgi:hypothetical protein